MAKTIGLVVKPDPHAVSRGDELETWLKTNGCDVLRLPSDAPPLAASRSERGMAPADLFCVVVLGGMAPF
jgi:NAD+ kinase